MKYDYHCSRCNKTVEIEKYASEIDRTELCTHCNDAMGRVFTPPRLYFNNTKVPEKYYNVGLGQVVDSDRHAQQIAKQRGLTEVGNEPLKGNLPPVSEKDYES